MPGLDEDGPGSPGEPASTAESQSASPETQNDPPAISQEFDESEASGIAEVLSAIEAGDPLPYDEDGQTFQNREGLLPSQPIGYYSEYTVETPGSPDRGARRLVVGNGGETYYTSDHYSSFTLIDPDDFTS